MEVGEGQFLEGLEEIPGKPSWATQGQGQDLNWHGEQQQKKAKGRRLGLPTKV